LVIAGTGAGVASAVSTVTAGPANVVIGCALNRNGDLRIVSRASQCRPTEHVVKLAGPQLPQTRQVNCNTGGNIQKAIDSAPVQLPLTVDITGTCTQAVQFSRDNVKLRAASPGAGITAPAPGDSPLYLDGARHVVLDGLTLTGGDRGVNAFNGASFTASGLHVSGGRWGVSLTGASSAQIDGLSVGQVAQAGIEVAGGADVQVSNATIGSGNFGVIAIGGHAELTGTTVTDSGGSGVVAENGGSVQLTGTTVEHAGDSGLFAWNGGSIEARQGSLIQYNNGGVASHDGSVHLVDARVVHNAASGVDIQFGRLITQGATIIEDNTGNGVGLSGNSAAEFGDQTGSSNLSGVVLPSGD
jgi:hypothetical protein